MTLLESSDRRRQGRVLGESRLPLHDPRGGEVDDGGVGQLPDHGFSVGRADTPLQTGMTFDLDQHNVLWSVVRQELHGRLRQRKDGSPSGFGVPTSICLPALVHGKRDSGLLLCSLTAWPQRAQDAGDGKALGILTECSA